MSHPYKNLSEKSFWRTSIASKHFSNIENLFEPSFNLNKKHRISSFGSCFATHIGKSLLKNGYNWYVPEKAPQGLSGKQLDSYGYDVFSARTGNIYTTTLLEQWVDWALENSKIPEEVWKDSDHYIDPFRPNIENKCFSSEQEVIESRCDTIDAFRKCITNSDVFIFTLGLTECWRHKHGYEYPLCPGTTSGNYDENQHIFVNQKYPEVLAALNRVIRKVKAVNKKVKFIFTVSPVPLVATMSKKHVLPATVYSKSVLRSVAGDLSEKYSFVDYFPSYEIINSPPFKGVFFESNQRSVSAYGVNFVMSHFHNSFLKNLETSKNSGSSYGSNNERDFCEESLLDAFRKHDG